MVQNRHCLKRLDDQKRKQCRGVCGRAGIGVFTSLSSALAFPLLRKKNIAYKHNIATLISYSLHVIWKYSSINLLALDLGRQPYDRDIYPDSSIFFMITIKALWDILCMSVNINVLFSRKALNNLTNSTYNREKRHVLTTRCCKWKFSEVIGRKPCFETPKSASKFLLTKSHLPLLSISNFLS